MENDFLSGLPEWAGTVALAVHGRVLAAWALFQAARVVRGEGLQAGKVLLVLATWVTWFGGIVLAQDDFTFTVMNVVLHGVPYFALLFRYARGRCAEGGYGPLRPAAARGPAGASSCSWRRWPSARSCCGTGSSGTTAPSSSARAASRWPPDLLALVVPLLALPQATHYLLDAFVWKPSRDPALLSRLGWAPGASEGSPRGTVTPSPVAMASPTD